MTNRRKQIFIIDKPRHKPRYKDAQESYMTVKLLVGGQEEWITYRRGYQRNTEMQTKVLPRSLCQAYRRVGDYMKRTMQMSLSWPDTVIILF